MTYDKIDREKVMSWLEGLAEDDWRSYHSDSEVSNIAKSALALFEEQEAVVRCCDCEHWDSQCHSCEHFDGIMQHDFYCADGEKRK